MRTLMLCILMLLSAFTHGANLIISGDTLMGATDVVVEGKLYDVSFQDGSCISLYSGCNESSDFVFHTPDSAVAAANALRDQVVLGNFDSLTEPTNGCPSLYPCEIITPFDLSFTPNTVQVVSFLNTWWAKHLQPPGPPGEGALLTGYDTDWVSSIGDKTWAVWTAQPAPVPLPSSIWLFFASILALQMYRRMAREERTI